MSKKVLTTGEVATYCGVNFRTVIRWVDAGKIKAYQLPGRGDRRIKVEDFIDFLKKNGMPVPEGLLITGGDKSRILVVEDDPNLARVMATILQKEGYDTETAYDGFQAGAMVESFIPDLITLDINMKGMGGLGVLEFLRTQEKYSKINILIISALDDEKLSECIEAGADDYIKKPFDHDTFMWQGPRN